MRTFNVYVGEDLRARMDKVKEPVNWSQVACQAFEIKLGEIAEAKEKKTMSDVIQRLKASKVEHESSEEKAGRAAGRNWAEKRATWAQLKEVNGLSGTIDRNPTIGLFDLLGEPAAYGFAEAVFGEDVGRHDIEEFWKVEAESDEPSDEFVGAFFDGALEVYSEVSAQL